MVQKLLMTSCIIFVWKGSAVQVAVAFFLSFFFLVAVMWYQPLINKRLFKLQVEYDSEPNCFAGSLTVRV